MHTYTLAFTTNCMLIHFCIGMVDGAARAGSSLFNEMRNAVFAKVCISPVIFLIISSPPLPTVKFFITDAV